MTLLLLKAHVHGYVGADGRVVLAYERKGRDSASSRLGRVYAAAKRAESGLSPEAADAVSTWQSANWDKGRLQQAFMGKRPEIKAEIEAAFRPVRDVLRREFGDTIMLHRGQRSFADGETSHPDRALFSWTADPAEAGRFAYGKLAREWTDAEIAGAVARYDATGFAKVRGTSYVRDKQYPDTFGIYDKSGQFVTDGDDLGDTLREKQAWTLKYNADRMKGGRVVSHDVPISDVVWIPGNLLSKEFIVKRNPLAHPDRTAGA